jgi:hypothetical protein
VQNGTTNNQNIVNMTDCYIFQAQKWIQNYGNMTVKGIFCSGGGSSGTLGYLIDNEGTTYGQLLVMGGVFYNEGTGVVLNPSGKASTWIAAVLTGPSGALNGALVPTLIVAGKYIQATALATNFNAGSAWTLFTPSASVGQFFRVNFVQEMTQAASSSSTFPSLTLSWTDAGGIARTATLVGTSTSNSTSLYTSGVGTIFTDGSTPITVTSASYASSGATPMQYALAVSLELV